MKLFPSLSLVIVTIFMFAQSVKAEKLNPLYDEVSMSTSSTTSSTSSSSKLSSSLELDYLFVENQTAVGGSLLLGGLVITGEYAPCNELTTGITNMAYWSAGAGLNKRIHILNFIIIEGRIGADYNNVTIKYDDGTKSDYEGTWGAFGNARAGIKLFSNTCVMIGYKWKFSEFNFNEDYMSTYMTAGVSFLF